MFFEKIFIIIYMENIRLWFKGLNIYCADRLWKGGRVAIYVQTSFAV